MPRIVYEYAGFQYTEEGKYRPKIDIRRVRSDDGEDDSYIAGTVTAGYGFESAQAAQDAAYRAIDAVEKTGEFPNMCDRF